MHRGVAEDQFTELLRRHRGAQVAAVEDIQERRRTVLRVPGRRDGADLDELPVRPVVQQRDDAGVEVAVQPGRTMAQVPAVDRARAVAAQCAVRQGALALQVVGGDFGEGEAACGQRLAGQLHGLVEPRGVGAVEVQHSGGEPSGVLNGVQQFPQPDVGPQHPGQLRLADPLPRPEVQERAGRRLGHRRPGGGQPAQRGHHMWQRDETGERTRTGLPSRVGPAEHVPDPLGGDGRGGGGRRAETEHDPLQEVEGEQAGAVAVQPGVAFAHEIECADAPEQVRVVGPVVDVGVGEDLAQRTHQPQRPLPDRLGGGTRAVVESRHAGPLVERGTLRLRLELHQLGALAAHVAQHDDGHGATQFRRHVNLEAGRVHRRPVLVGHPLSDGPHRERVGHERQRTDGLPGHDTADARPCRGEADDQRAVRQRREAGEPVGQGVGVLAAAHPERPVHALPGHGVRQAVLGGEAGPADLPGHVARCAHLAELGVVGHVRGHRRQQHGVRQPRPAAVRVDGRVDRDEAGHPAVRRGDREDVHCPLPVRPRCVRARRVRDAQHEAAPRPARLVDQPEDRARGP
ncbi:hypothetical protein STAL104432_19755 [Streptomyces albus]